MRYAVPEAWHELGVRRWGFHGASHKFIAERSAELLGREDVAERARRLYVDGGKTPVRQPRLAGDLLSSGRQFSLTGILNGVGHRHQHGHEPAIRSAAKQSRGRSGRFEAVPYARRNAGHLARGSRSASFPRNPG